MSNEMAPKSLKHKDDRHVQTRLDYMLLYRSEGKAKIIRTLESWTDTKYAEWYKGIADSKEQKSEPPTEDLWITMSYDQFSLFVYGTIQHDTIKQQVDELVALKHIERRVNPAYPYGPPQYRLNRELIQKSLDELEIPANLFDLAPIFISPRKKRTPQEKYPQGRGKKPTRDMGKIPPGYGEISHPSNNLSENTDNQAKNESTYPASESQSDAPGSSEPTHALSCQHFQHILTTTLTYESLSPSEQDELYEHIDQCIECSKLNLQRRGMLSALREKAKQHAETEQRINDLQQDVEQELRRKSGALSQKEEPDETTTTTHSGNTGATQRLRVAAGVGHSNAAANERDVRASQQSALLAPSAAPARARVETRHTNKGQGKATEKQKYAVYFTLEGSQFRGWYEEITGTALDETAANARACNALGKKQGATYDNLKLVLEAIDNDPWVDANGVAITPQDLASDDGKQRWEKWLQVAQRRQKKASNETSKSAQPSKNGTVSGLPRFVPPSDKDTGMVLWQDSTGTKRMMTYAEADENGWEGGFGEFIQHTQYGRTTV